jgi:hypothetical protein
MKNLVTLLFIILMIFSCKKNVVHTETQTKKLESIAQSKKIEDELVYENLLTLNTQTKTGRHKENIHENLFGKFFCDRAEFYIIKNPRNEIYECSPESITLYYLDGKLRQTKYILSSNIVTNLLVELGNFNILGLDSKNKEIVRNRDVIRKTMKGVTLNESLDNYELKWVFGDKEIKYRVMKGSKNKFIYLEKVKNFEKEFQAIESYCM